MGRPKVTLNHAGVKALLGSSGVRAALTRHAENVARAAGGDVKIVQATTGGYRAVVQVHDTSPGAIAREARTGRLGRALDSA